MESLIIIQDFAITETWLGNHIFDNEKDRESHGGGVMLAVVCGSNNSLQNHPYIALKIGMRLICSKIYLLFLPELLKIFPYYSLKYHLLFPNYSTLRVRK